MIYVRSLSFLFQILLLLPKSPNLVENVWDYYFWPQCCNIINKDDFFHSNFGELQSFCFNKQKSAFKSMWEKNKMRGETPNMYNSILKLIFNSFNSI